MSITGASILGNTLLDLLSLDKAEVATLGSACNASYVRFYNDHSNVTASSWLMGLSNNAFTLVRGCNAATTVLGIGTNAPIIAAGVDVRGDLNFSGSLMQGGAPYQASQWTSTTVAGTPAIYYSSNTGAARVGINTATPEFTLTVDGNIGFTGQLYQNGTIFTSGGGGGSGFGNSNLGTDFSYIPIYGSANDGTKTLTTNDTNTDVRTLYSFELKAGRYILNANIPFQNLTNLVLMDNLNWATVGIYLAPYSETAGVPNSHPLAFTSMRINTSTDLITQPFECVLEVVTTGTYVVVVGGKGHTLRFGNPAAVESSKLRIVPVASIGFSQASDVAAALQIAPVRTVFTPSVPTSEFTVTAPGVYTAMSSNVDVFLNGAKYVYASDGYKDFSLGPATPGLSNTSWTITLESPALPDDIVDITVYPQATASTAFAAGYLYQDVTINPTPWNVLTDNSSIRFSGNKVVIDGDLIVGGSVVGGSNTSGFVIGQRYDVTSVTGGGGTGIAVQWQPAYPAPTFDVPAGGYWAMTSNVGAYRYAGNEIVYNVNATATVVQQPNAVAWGCNVAAYGDVGLSVPFPVNLAQYFDRTVLGDLLLTMTSSNAAFVNSFQAYARVDAASADHVIVRYVTGTADNTLATLGVGASVKVQGTITYATPQMTGGVPTAFLPPQFNQDTLGRLAVNTTGAPPRGHLDVVSTCNLPAFVADQQGGQAGVDTMQIKVAGATKMVMDYAGNVGVGTTTPRKMFDVHGDMMMTGMMYDSNMNSLWIPGSTVQWLPVTPAPAFGLSSGGNVTFAYSSAQGYYRYVGHEVVYQINVAGTVGAQPALSADFTLAVPQSAPLDTPAGANGAAARYLTNSIVGELWLSVVKGTSSNTFKAYARTSTTSATTLTLRYVTGTTDDTLSRITVGSVVSLQGTITYASPLLNNVNGVPLTYIPAAFAQDQTGKVAFNTGGNAPRGQLDMVVGNGVGLIVDQRGAGDILQLRSNATSTVVVDSVGQVGVGTGVPQGLLHVAGTNCNVVISSAGNVGIGTTLPQAALHVQALAMFQSIYSPGSIIQVTTFNSDAYQINLTSTSYVNTNVGVSITPKFANSLLHISANISVQISNISNCDCWLSIFKNGAQLGGNYWRWYPGNGNYYTVLTIQKNDVAGSTSPRSYFIYGATTAGGSINIGNTGSNSITVMEIAQ